MIVTVIVKGGTSIYTHRMKRKKEEEKEENKEKRNKEEPEVCERI